MNVIELIDKALTPKINESAAAGAEQSLRAALNALQKWRAEMGNLDKTQEALESAVARAVESGDLENESLISAAASAGVKLQVLDQRRRQLNKQGLSCHGDFRAASAGVINEITNRLESVKLHALAAVMAGLRRGGLDAADPREASKLLLPMLADGKKLSDIAFTLSVASQCFTEPESQAPVAKMLFDCSEQLTALDESLKGKTRNEHPEKR